MKGCVTFLAAAIIFAATVIMLEGRNAACCVQQTHLAWLHCGPIR